MKNKLETILIILNIIALAACANNSHLPASKVTYQVKSNAQLSGYANNVSRGFGKASSSARGIAYPSAYPMGAVYPSSYGGNTPNPYVGGWIIREQIDIEVSDCEQYVKTFQSCADTDKMISVLAQCLNTVMNYRNPLLTYSYNHLDSQGQQYWAYLLNWRKSNSMSSFNPQEFNILSQYAGSGYLTQNY